MHTGDVVMELPRFLESWSWLAGIIGTTLALVVVVQQIWSSRRLRSRNGDWEVLDRAFHGIKIGAPIRSLQFLDQRQVARSGDGKIKMVKWCLPNSNELSVTYDSEQDRIVYVELDWSSTPDGVNTGIDGLLFGVSTLSNIRTKYKSNGFAYRAHAMFSTQQGILNFNAFELSRTPTIVVVFISLLDDASSLKNLPEEIALTRIGSLCRLEAIAVADESYLDQIWGHEKIYDPASAPIKL